VKQPARFAIQLRHPEWADGFDVEVEGETEAQRDHEEEAQMLEETERWAAHKDSPSGYDTVDGYEPIIREWHDGQTIAFNLHASVRRLAADPRAENLRGLVALQYGPFLYCIEQCDYPVSIDRLYLPETAALDVQDVGAYRIVRGLVRSDDQTQWPGGLYAEVPATHELAFRAVPYFAWDERRPGAMKVWLPTAPPIAPLRGLEDEAIVKTSFTPENSAPASVAEALVPKSSHDHPARVCHFWPHLGGKEWIDYTWSEPRRVTSARVYWFDDTGSGQCRLPKSARLLWKDGDSWKPVGGALPVAADRWCEVDFPAVTTAALRLELEQQDRFASGVLAWNVFDD
jgi:hypothetical protein